MASPRFYDPTAPTEESIAPKKATFELPQDLHCELHLHAVSSSPSMGDLVIKYIENGLLEDGVARQ